RGPRRVARLKAHIEGHRFRRPAREHLHDRAAGRSALALRRLPHRCQRPFKTFDTDAVESDDAEILRHTETQLLRCAEDTGVKEIALGPDRGRSVYRGNVEEHEGGFASGIAPAAGGDSPADPGEDAPGPSDALDGGPDRCRSFSLGGQRPGRAVTIDRQ